MAEWKGGGGVLTGIRWWGKRWRGYSRMSIVTRAMQYSLGFSFSSPYFSSASTTAKSAVSRVESRMVLYGMLGFRLSAYIRKVPPAGEYNTHKFFVSHIMCLLFDHYLLRHLESKQEIDFWGLSNKYSMTNSVLFFKFIHWNHIHRMSLNLPIQRDQNRICV